MPLARKDESRHRMSIDRLGYSVMLTMAMLSAMSSNFFNALRNSTLVPVYDVVSSADFTTMEENEFEALLVLDFGIPSFY